MARYKWNKTTHQLEMIAGLINVDSALSSTSENPVQNKVINQALSAKADSSALGTAATKDVPTSGNASTTQVVMGNDSRLSDSRNAADVYSWAKASSKPTYKGNEINTNSAETGTAQSSITSTIAVNTSVDDAVGILLNNDVTLNSDMEILEPAVASIESNVARAETAAASAEAAKADIDELFEVLTFDIDFSTGQLTYSIDTVYTFTINTTTGNLEWEVA